MFMLFCDIINLSGQVVHGFPLLTQWITDINSITSEGVKMKTCTKCLVEKAKTEFSLNKAMKGGLQSKCKACCAIYNAAWAKDHPEKIRAFNAAYRKNNPEKVKACVSTWEQANKEKRKAYYSARRKANLAKERESRAAWRKANPEKSKARSASWKQANPERAKESAVAWRKANPEATRIIGQNRRAKKRANGGKLSSDLSTKLFKLQRGKCPCCNKPLGEDYQLDHIVPLKLGGANEDWNIQLLRATCNMQKNAKHPVEFMRSRGFLL